MPYIIVGDAPGTEGLYMDALAPRLRLPAKAGLEIKNKIKAAINVFFTI
jgi:hypothetical protein